MHLQQVLAFNRSHRRCLCHDMTYDSYAASSTMSARQLRLKYGAGAHSSTPSILRLPLYAVHLCAHEQRPTLQLQQICILAHWPPGLPTEDDRLPLNRDEQPEPGCLVADEATALHQMLSRGGRMTQMRASNIFLLQGNVVFCSSLRAGICMVEGLHMPFQALGLGACLVGR